jgi:hypothetical protein
MESSRDSSVWRNLAVTFGGGLALGAVGMRLTQTALRPVEVAPRPEPQPRPQPEEGRLDRMERRLERIEKMPPAAPTVASQIDQKVLEAVVGAVDARINQHAGQVERRIADLEAKFTVELQSLHQQHRQIGEVTDKNFAELQRQFRQEAMGLRTAVTEDLRHFQEIVVKTAAEQAAVRSELQTLHQQDERIIDSAEQRFADLREECHQEIAAQLETRVKGLEQSLEGRMVTAAAAAAAAKFDEQLVPLRNEVEQKERELVELRQKLAESERAVLDVILSIGDVCRHAADRIGGPSPMPPAASQIPAVVPDAPRAELHPTVAATVEPAASPIPGPTLPAPSAVERLPVPPLAVDPSLAQSIPDFLSDANGTRNWRIPLVSSFLVMSACCVALMHYL